MLAHHRDLDNTAEQRYRFASSMSLAADDAGLPDDPEFRAALVGYLERGTRLAMHDSGTGAEVAQHAPVPRWGWGVASPYQPRAGPASQGVLVSRRHGAVEAAFGLIFSRTASGAALESWSYLRRDSF